MTDYTDALALFIGPAVIAAIITGMINILLSRRSARLENVTAERSKWREQIREISKDIQAQDENRLSVALSSLKLHINAFGIPHNLSDEPIFLAGHILWDTHIWTLIYRMEKQIRAGDVHELEKECDLLIDYLSLLLKYDWERAKNELNSSLVKVFGWIFTVVGVIGQILLISYMLYDTVPFHHIVKSAMLLVIGMIAIVLFIERKIKRAIRDYSTAENGSSIFSQVLYRFYPYIKIAVLVLLYIGVIELFPLALGVERMNFMEPAINVIAVICIHLYILGVSMISFERKRGMRYEYYYVVEVNRKKNEFYRGMKETLVEKKQRNEYRKNKSN